MAIPATPAYASGFGVPSSLRPSKPAALPSSMVREVRYLSVLSLLKVATVEPNCFESFFASSAEMPGYARKRAPPSGMSLSGYLLSRGLVLPPPRLISGRTAAVEITNETADRAGEVVAGVVLAGASSGNGSAAGVSQAS